MTMIIQLPRDIAPALASEIEKESVFVSPFLAQLKVTPEMDSVAVELSDPTKETVVREKLDRFLGLMLRELPNFETKIFINTERRDSGPFETNVHQQMVERRWIHDYQRGRAALNGPALALLHYIDRTANNLYHETFEGAVERDFPALVDADLLWKCGYFDSHPNAVCFVGHIVEDFDTIESFRVSNADSETVQLPPNEHVHLPGMCLNPAACFPSYPTMSGETIGSEGRIMTWKGRVFRFESRNVSGLDRLWEFNVRELVFAGSDTFTADCRRRTLPLIEELAGRLDLECVVETAADPFFATISAAKSFWQLAQEVKNEILLPLGPGADGSMKRMACGSINLHGNFFGDRFDFKTDGESASTACVGLGLERWVLAAFTQHGFDPARWPAGVRKEIFG